MLPFLLQHSETDISLQGTENVSHCWTQNCRSLSYRQQSTNPEIILELYKYILSLADRRH